MSWLFAILLLLASPPAVETVVVDAQAKARPFPHYWEKLFGSGRAILTLRESWRRDLREVKRATGLGYVRFHGILLDEVGVYDEDAQGKAVYNFSYVDQIYDGLLEEGVRPFVELSFMPRKLASKPLVHSFWYKPVVAPPRSAKRWEELVYQLARHLVERYGEDEVARWYFEVWNEPNIDFWAGEPKEATYYKLYDQAARAVKRASPRLRVGGPATAQAAWVDRFIRHVVETGAPVDFVSTHVYANDTAADVFGTKEEIPRTQMVCRAVKKVHDQVAASARPALPILWSEFNASYKNEREITDALYMGPWLADTIRQCDGLVEMLAYWSLSDVFEEQGVVKEPFYGGYGLLAAGNLPKPALAAFRLLHLLGAERLPIASERALATRRPDGALVVALWNLLPPGETGPARRVALQVRGLPAGQHEAVLHRVDREHGSLIDAYDKLGRPRSPTRAQLQALRQAAAPPPPERRHLDDGKLELTLPPHGLSVIEIR